MDGLEHGGVGRRNRVFRVLIANAPALHVDRSQHSGAAEREADDEHREHQRHGEARLVGEPGEPVLGRGSPDQVADTHRLEPPWVGLTFDRARERGA